jgi:hypothetical protein
MAAPGVAVPGSVVAIGSQASPAGPQGIQGPAIVNAFVTKSAAYTLTSADSGKYVICSGGSWTLTLPAPASGLVFQVRNDMGISGTIGTITLSPTGGTVDGLASIALLPQQECTVLTDGTNWRTFGLRREVILGTQDITSATASVTILLPAGYRLFLLDLTGLAGSVDNQNMQMLLSSDGGSTFYSTANYYFEYFINSALTTLAASGGGLTYGYLGTIGTYQNGSIQLKIYPGSSTQRATWQCQSDNWASAGSFLQQALVGGSFNAATVIMNALKILPASGVINNMFLTVKGIV